jgi:hypothetical protein
VYEKRRNRQLACDRDLTLIFKISKTALGHTQLAGPNPRREVTLILKRCRVPVKSVVTKNPNIDSDVKEGQPTIGTEGLLVPTVKMPL